MLRDAFICCAAVSIDANNGEVAKLGATYERALIFLLLRLRRRTRFFLHLALILNDVSGRRLAHAPTVAVPPMCGCGISARDLYKEVPCGMGSAIDGLRLGKLTCSWMRIVVG